MSADYQHLNTCKNKFILEGCSKKELSKEELFRRSSPNIKLQKFKGYESLVDIYTFKKEFEKVYIKSSPKRLLADVLKNNFLEDLALSLVNEVECIK